VLTNNPENGKADKPKTDTEQAIPVIDGEESAAT